MKKRYYKNGDPEVYRDFNEATWNNLTDREKALWSPYTEIEQAPIPPEVIEFQRKEQEKRKDLEAEIAELKAQLEAKEPATPVEQREADNDDMAEKKSAAMTDEQRKAVVKDELRRLGIKFAPNSKLETLEHKLEEYANNTGKEES